MSFLEWIGLKRKFDYSKAQFLGHLVGFTVMLFFIVMIFGAVFTLVAFIQSSLRLPPYDQTNDGAAIRNIGLVLAALVGAPFIIWRTSIAAKQVGVAEEALYNEKISSAANGLSSRYQKTVVSVDEQNPEGSTIWVDDQVLRAASIDQFEGLVRERPELAPRLVKLIASYIRGTFPTENLEITEPPFRAAIPRMDLQQAVAAISSLLPMAREIDKSDWRLDLRRCNFDGVNFDNGYFYAVNFTESRLESCSIQDAEMSGANFSGALLNFSWFRGTDLTGAKLDRCILNRPIPQPGGMAFSINLADSIKGLSLVASDISAVDYLGEPDELRTTFGTNDTMLPDTFHPAMPDLDIRRLAVGAERSNNPMAIRAFETVSSTGFEAWSPYQSNDMATGHLRMELMSRLGLNTWPYL